MNFIKYGPNLIGTDEILYVIEGNGLTLIRYSDSSELHIKVDFSSDPKKMHDATKIQTSEIINLIIEKSKS